MGREFVEAIEAAPIVAAVKDDNGLEMCLKSDIDAVFILYGDICTISDIVARVKDAGKIAMVHMDLINGLSSKDISTDFIRKYTRAGRAGSNISLSRAMKSSSHCSRRKWTRDGRICSIAAPDNEVTSQLTMEEINDTAQLSDL